MPIIQKPMYALFKKPTELSKQLGHASDVPLMSFISATEEKCWQAIESAYSTTREKLTSGEGAYYSKLITISWESDE